MRHPCIAAVTHDVAEGRLERDVTLAAWIGAHVHVDGEVLLTEPRWCWTPAGGALLEPGTYSLAKLGAIVADSEPKLQIAFDPWCTILGYAYPDSVPASGKPNSEQEAEVHRATMVGLRGLSVLQAYLPDVAEWLASLTQVIVCLDGAEKLSRSASAEDLPGLIFADAISEIAFLELAVHEASHHLLYLSEAGGPLIDAAESRTFDSPLRPDPRPLKGILLAYHALAYVCSFYKDLARSEAGDAMIDMADFLDLRSKMYSAQETLDGAADGLTDRGRAFMALARQVAEYVS